MTSKRSAASKRTNVPRACDHTKQFLKDWTRLSHSGRYDMNALKDVMMLLVAHQAPLPAEWKDHELDGEWKGNRECHVGGDFLLIYQLSTDTNPEKIVFVRAGTHSDLFG